MNKGHDYDFCCKGNYWAEEGYLMKFPKVNLETNLIFITFYFGIKKALMIESWKVLSIWRR